MNDTIKTVGSIFGCIIPVIAFLYWHFKTIDAFKDQINDLKLQMKELENKDNLQQQTIDQLKELYPVINEAFQHLKKIKV